jgi:general secretion pathway protein L
MSPFSRTGRHARGLWSTTGLGPRIRAFLAWWRAGLAVELPRPLARLLLGDRRLVRARLDGDRIVLEVFGGSPAATPGAPLALDDGRPPEEALRRVRAAARRRGVVLVVPPALVLMKEQDVPEAATRSLKDAVRYGLAQWTPFSADEVFWSVRVVSRRGAQARIAIRMVPKAALGPALARLEQAGLAPAALALGPGDLLPIDARHAVRERRARMLDLGLVAGTSLLVAANCALLFAAAEGERASLAAALQEEVQLRQKADAIAKKIEAIGARDAFVAARRAGTRPLAEIAATLAGALPEDVEVRELRFSKGKARLLLIGPDGWHPELELSASGFLRTEAVRPQSDLADGRRAFEWLVVAGDGR